MKACWRVMEERAGSDAPWTLDNRSGGITVAELNNGLGSQRHFYHCNTLYSTFALTDETGAIAEGYQYDAYGRTIVRSVSFSTFRHPPHFSTATYTLPLKHSVQALTLVMERIGGRSRQDAADAMERFFEGHARAIDDVFPCCCSHSVSPLGGLVTRLCCPIQVS